MKAAICTQYGPPEVMKIVEVEKPVPKKNEVLVRVMASPVNSGDARVRGLVVKGFLRIVMRFVLGFNKPRKPILGTVFSGVVEQTGKNVKDFNPGDEVFGITGFKFGTCAEYVVVSEKGLIAKKPANATFEEAAAIPFGGTSALYFLEKAKMTEKTNPRVLVYGATGSVGTAVIQVAKYCNAHVTAVCSEEGESLVKELGADEVILYTQEDFTQRNEKFDIVFDAVGKTTKEQCASLLISGGHYINICGLDIASERKEQLEFLRRRFEEGKYKATIDRVYSLDEVVEAHRYVDTGRKKGNVVLKMAGREKA
ncbi:MAG: NAD(P)-dependent alcohol dehydrogenase [Proteobacteria bacterium]|nr:NAD(P)-dependent alcohol dehydrogenase [Pseudomonadota bacterium]